MPGIADSGRFADDLAALFETMGETSRELGIGTLILVDELQEASAAELTAVNTAVHQLGQDSAPLPVMFVGAGLPSLPAQLAAATSYAERLYDYRSIGLLQHDSARNALRDYAEAWVERLRLAPNHANNWGLVQIAALASDEQLRDWLLA